MLYNFTALALLMSKMFARDVTMSEKGAHVLNCIMILLRQVALALSESLDGTLSANGNCRIATHPSPANLRRFLSWRVVRLYLVRDHQPHHATQLLPTHIKMPGTVRLSSLRP